VYVGKQSSRVCKSVKRISKPGQRLAVAEVAGNDLACREPVPVSNPTVMSVCRMAEDRVSDFVETTSLR
jgi:hypothetical protein